MDLPLISALPIVGVQIWDSKVNQVLLFNNEFFRILELFLECYALKIIMKN
jgi:hypothetical protein